MVIIWCLFSRTIRNSQIGSELRCEIRGVSFAIQRASFPSQQSTLRPRYIKTQLSNLTKAADTPRSKEAQWTVTHHPLPLLILQRYHHHHHHLSSSLPWLTTRSTKETAKGRRSRSRRGRRWLTRRGHLTPHSRISSRLSQVRVTK